MLKATPQGLQRLDDLAKALEESGVGLERSQMFGCPGLRRPGKGKFFVTIWGEDLVVKLPGEDHARAMALPGAHRFEPMPGRAMGAWIVIPAELNHEWLALARAAEAGLG